MLDGEKVYLVFTTSCDADGSNVSVTINKVCSSLIDAFKHRIKIDYEENTALYPEKSSIAWKATMDDVLLELEDKAFLSVDEYKMLANKMDNCLDLFSRKVDEKDAWDMPSPRAIVKVMTVGSDEDEESYDM